MLGAIGAMPPKLIRIGSLEIGIIEIKNWFWPRWIGHLWWHDDDILPLFGHTLHWVKSGLHSDTLRNQTVIQHGNEE